MGSKRSVLTLLAQITQTQETRCKSAMCADWLAVHHTTVLLPNALACAPTADSGRCLLTSSSGYFILHHCILTVRPRDNPPPRLAPGPRGFDAGCRARETATPFCAAPTETSWLPPAPLRHDREPRYARRAVARSRCFKCRLSTVEFLKFND